jgi:tetratricopeptide (TPR) repeat protein
MPTRPTCGATGYAAGRPDGTAQVLRFGAALRRYWDARSRYAEVLALLLPVLERPWARADPGLFAAALVTADIAAEHIDFAAARRLGEQGVEFARHHGDNRLLTESLRTLCLTYYFTGEPDRARPLGQESVQRARQLGDDVVLGRSLLAYLLPIRLIDPGRSRRLFAEAIACTERSGDRYVNYLLHNDAGCDALRVGDIPAARAHLEQAAQVQQAVGLSSHHASGNLGWVLRQEGNPDGARSLFEAALQMSRRSGDPSGLAYASLGLACLAADRGDWHLAGKLHGAAQAVLDRTGERLQEPEARYQRDSLDQVRARLGLEQFDQVYAHGTTLSLEQVFDEALAEHRLSAGCDRQGKYPRTAPSGGSSRVPLPWGGYAPRLPGAAAGNGVALLASGVAGLVIRTGWCELEHRVAVRLGGEGLDRGVLGRLEVRPRGGGEADVPL